MALLQGLTPVCMCRPGCIYHHLGSDSWTGGLWGGSHSSVGPTIPSPHTSAHMHSHSALQLTTAAGLHMEIHAGKNSFGSHSSVGSTTSLPHTDPQDGLSGGADCTTHPFPMAHK